MARCPMCFQEKPLVPVAVKELPDQCKGCFFKIDQILGYLAFHGVTTSPESQQVALQDTKLRKAEALPKKEQ